MFSKSILKSSLVACALHSGADAAIVITDVFPTGSNAALAGQNYNLTVLGTDGWFKFGVDDAPYGGTDVADFASAQSTGIPNRLAPNFSASGGSYYEEAFDPKFSWTDGDALTTATAAIGLRYNLGSGMSYSIALEPGESGTLNLWLAPGGGLQSSLLTADFANDAEPQVSLFSIGGAGGADGNDRRYFTVGFTNDSALPDTLTVGYDGQVGFAAALVVVPEPTSAILLMIGGLALTARSRRANAVA